MRKETKKLEVCGWIVPEKLVDEVAAAVFGLVEVDVDIDSFCFLLMSDSSWKLILLSRK
jgi:hypothetical protein